MRILLLVSTALLAACTCERSPSSQLPGAKRVAGKGGGQASIKVRQPDSRSWVIGAKPVMAKLAFMAGEVSHRLARPNFPIADVARVLDRVVPEIPNHPDPSFSQWKNALKQATTALRDSKDGKKDFNRVVDACVGCHIRYAPSSLARVQALRFSKAPVVPKK